MGKSTSASLFALVNRGICHKEPIMAVKIQKVDVWSAEIRDQAGALDRVLAPLAAVGADLSFLVARRQPDKPGMGIVFLGGLKGAKQTAAAQKAGLTKSSDIVSLMVEVSNKPGLAHKLVERLAAAGINMRAMMASVTGTKCVMEFAFDTTADRDQAAKILRK